MTLAGLIGSPMTDSCRVMRREEEHGECSEQIVRGFRHQVEWGVLRLVRTRLFFPPRSSGPRELPPLNCPSPSYQNPIRKVSHLPSNIVL